MESRIRSPQVDLERKRARAALEAVKKAQNDLGKDGGKKYGQLARSGSADIMTMGLGQTLAFWAAKKEKHHLQLLNNVTTWLVTQKLLKEAEKPLDWVMQLEDTGLYRRATQETLALLAWIKRFSEAELL